MAPRSKSNSRKAQPSTHLSPPTLHPHAAGIDVGAREVYVAVPPGADPRPVRCFEIPACPECESQERRCRTSPQMFLLRNEVECPLGVCHGTSYIAPNHGISGTVYSDRTW